MLISAILDSSAALLNDVNKVTYTYAKQLPYFKIVYTKAQNRLLLLGHPTLAEVSVVSTVTAGIDEVTLVDGTAARDKMSQPVSLFERTVGGTEDDWDEMTRGKWEELRTPNATLDNWAWREGIIRLNPATVDRQVKVRYSRFFASITDETSAIEHQNFADFLIHGTAAYIAAFVMKDMVRAEALTVLANDAMQIALAGAVKTMQYTPAVRPRYFFRGR